MKTVVYKTKLIKGTEVAGGVIALIKGISSMLGVLLMGRGEFQCQPLAQKASLLYASFFSIGWVIESSQEEVPKGQMRFLLQGLGRSWGQEARDCLTGTSDTDQQDELFSL